jgi:hypothetical protein
MKWSKRRLFDNLAEYLRFLDWKRYPYVVRSRAQSGCVVGKRLSLQAFVFPGELEVRQFSLLSAHNCEYLESRTILFAQDFLRILQNPLLRQIDASYLARLFHFNQFQKLKDTMIPTFFEKKPTRECQICFSGVTKALGCSLCAHTFCHECLTMNIKSKNTTRILTIDACPAPSCKGKIDISHLDVLPETLKRKYNLAVEMKELSTFDLVTCSWCSIPAIRDDDENLFHVPYFECPQVFCKKLTCTKCLANYHEFTPCVLQDTRLEEFKQAFESAGLRFAQCPICRHVSEIEANFCNKLLCLACPQTKTLFCACCSRTFGCDQDCYRHFCRSFETDPITNCLRKDCRHCFIWSSELAATHANEEFRREFPQFAG